MTFPFLTFQISPQFLWMRWLKQMIGKDGDEWEKGKSQLSKNILPISAMKFIENLGQLVMLLCLVILDPNCFGPNQMKPLTKAFWYTKFFGTFLKTFVSQAPSLRRNNNEHNMKQVSQQDGQQGNLTWKDHGCRVAHILVHLTAFWSGLLAWYMGMVYPYGISVW